MVIDCDIRQRNALFDLRSLAGIRQFQIALCESDLAEAGNSETQNKRLKCDCFHIVAVTLPRFSILRYQIIHRFSEPSIDPPDQAFNAECRSQRTVSLSQRKNKRTAASASRDAPIVGQPHRLPASG